MEARFSATIQTGPGAHPASCKMGTGSFPGGKERPGRDADPSPLLVPWSSKSRAIPLLPLWAVRPVQSLSACTRVHSLLVPWSRKSRTIPLLPLWAVRPVQSLSAYTTVHSLLVPWARKSRAIPLLPPMGRTACAEPQCLYNGALPSSAVVKKE